jgi:hypothetical protein
MKPLTRTLAAAALAVVVIALAAVPAAQAQPNRFPEPPQQPVFIPGGGTDLFRALMDKEGIQPLRAQDLNNMWGASDDMIVVVLGNPNPQEWQREPLRWARMAVAANGAALIASDSSFAVHEAGREPGWNNQITRFNGATVSASRPDYHRQPDCPYVVPVSPEEVAKPPKPPGRVWSVFRGLTKLATNQPTFLEELPEYRGEYQYPLARLPKSSWTQWGNRFQPPPLFAVGGDGPNQWNGNPGYSFLAVADSSVFINQMLMEPGTDNLEFTLRTIEYLQGPGKHRKKCLFFENGRIVDKFDGLRSALAKPKPKIPPEAMPNIGSFFGKNQDKLVAILDDRADKLQSADSLHEALVGPPGSARERNRFGGWVEAVAVILAISISFMLLRRTWSARQPMDVPPAPTTGAGAASTGPPGVFDRRQRELVRRNNLFEPVRNLMREFFDSVGAPPNPGPRLPTLEISDAVRKPESLRQAIRDMWRLAYGPPQPISAQRWFELEPYFNRLRQAHADGKWRFVTDGT